MKLFSLWVFLLFSSLLYGSSYSLYEPHKISLGALSESKKREQIRHIENITQAIDNSNKLDALEVLKLYNERGITFMFLGELEYALDDFNHILYSLTKKTKEEKQLFGAAIWGRMFCHAFLGLEKETYEDIQTINFFIIENNHCNCKRKTEYTYLSTEKSLAIPCAQFAHPNEKISSQECRARVYQTAQTMRTLALAIKDLHINWLVTNTIDQLESFGNYCCEDAANWTSCLGPIVDGWHCLQDSAQKLVKMFDKGVSLAPYIAGPGR